jgi:hypothetical protein
MRKWGHPEGFDPNHKPDTDKNKPKLHRAVRAAMGIRSKNMKVTLPAIKCLEQK